MLWVGNKLQNMCVCVCVSSSGESVVCVFLWYTPRDDGDSYCWSHRGGDMMITLWKLPRPQEHNDHRHTFKLLGEWHTGLKHKMMPSLINQYFLSLKTCKHWLKTHRLPHFFFIHSYDSPLPDDEKFSLKTLLSKVRRVFESCFSSQYLRLP